MNTGSSDNGPSSPERTVQCGRLRFFVEESELIVPLEGERIAIGRDPDNDVVLPDRSVSRHHAELSPELGRWRIRDLGSTNGVQINGSPVPDGMVGIGDRLRVGIFDLQVELDTDATPEANMEELASATIVRHRQDFLESPELSVLGQSEDAHEVSPQSTRVATRHLSLLSRLARELLRTDSRDEVLSKVMEVAFEALPIERGFILLGQAGDTQCELARVRDWVEARPTWEVPISQTILNVVMREEVALLTVDATDDGRLAGGESIKIHGIHSAMCAPLWSENRITGFIQVDSPLETGRLTEQHLDFLIVLANYAAVASEWVRQRRLRSRLERYHSPAVVDEILREKAAPDSAESRLRRAEVTVLFADIVGFTAFSEKASPEEVAALLGGYCSRAVDVIFAAEGTLDKFIGDCVMAFFGAPVEQPDHARRAVLAGVAIQESMREWNREREGSGLPPVQCRVGLNTGQVVVGDIGSATRVDYTILGNTVNVAARLESTVATPGEVVISEATRSQLGDEIRVEGLGEYPLKGLQQQVKAYRVLLHGGLDETTVRLN